MNDEPLSDREQEMMRETVLAAAQRLRAGGARRAPLIAGAVALVLIGGITGGAITTAALLGGGDVATTPTPTAPPAPAPTPSETPTPEPPPARGVEPYGGECANVLTDAEAEAATGMDMMRSDYAWKTGANTVLGGIDCVWVSEGAYLASTVDVFAYADVVVPDAVRQGAIAGCVPRGGENTDVRCTQTAVVDGMWLFVRVTGPQEAVSQAGADALLASVSARLGDFPAGAPADRTEQWWTAPDCAAVAGALDPAVYGFERVALLDQPDLGSAGSDQPEAIPSAAGAVHSCDLHFTSGSGDTATGEVVSMHVVRGGAAAFPTAEEAAGSRRSEVEGARAAVIGPSLNRFEGAGEVVVVTDGVNILTVTPDFIRDATEAEPLAAALLAMMHP